MACQFTQRDVLLAAQCISACVCLCFLKVSVIKAKLHEEVGLPAGKQKLVMGVSCLFIPCYCKQVAAWMAFAFDGTVRACSLLSLQWLAFSLLHSFRSTQHTIPVWKSAVVHAWQCCITLYATITSVSIFADSPSVCFWLCAPASSQSSSRTQIH